MTERLALVERAADLGRVPDGFAVVSASPEVEAELQAAGRDFHRPEDHVPEAELEERGLAAYGTVERLCDELDGIARDVLDEDEAAAPGRWHFFWLKVAYDAVMLRAWQTRALVAALEPGELAFAPRPDSDDGSLLSMRESVWARVLGVMLPRLGVAPRPLAVGPADEPVRRPSAGRSLRDAAAAVRHHVGPLAHRLRRGGRGGSPTVLMLDFSYGIPPVAAELSRLGAAAVLWPGGDTSRAMGSPRVRAHARAEPPGPDSVERLWRAVEASSVVRGAFLLEGIDLWPAARPFLERAVRHGFPDALVRRRTALAVLADVGPDVVLASMAAHPLERAACAAARQLGIPTVVSRHGELGLRALPMPAYEDLDAVDWELCWGAWEEAWVARHAHRPVRTRVTGAPVIEDAIRRPLSRRRARRLLGLGEGEPVVLFAATNYSGNRWYAGRRMPSDSEYYRMQVRTVESLLAVDGLRVVLKEHPGSRHSAIDRWCEQFAPEGRTLAVRQPAFARLIEVADAVVIDAASTTLVQALFGPAPIYLVDSPVYKWEPGVAEHLLAHGIPLCKAEDVGRLLGEDLAAGHLAERRGYPQEAREPLIAGGPPAAGRTARAVLDIAGGR